MRLIIDHQTRYHYADVVRRSTQYLRLTPHSTARQQILSWELELPGGGHLHHGRLRQHTARAEPGVPPRGDPDPRPRGGGDLRRRPGR
ncbi:hypothetical protein MF133_22720 [Aeromonas caviae]|uniref:transglutaminase N-terminal domain-containing protein n=1 Tax=Aeromonas caviae TaxID=648 RepID=UPI001EEFBCB0|nr:transglutaminase N-terminal domain-containing protein [Aeromonas caviae]ULH02871.1 hypothetical protein MF133_22720 [Aeromonas caviae]